MSLVLEVEFLTGVCRAAREPGDDVPDWPPQPDRAFSALASAWAARGERDDERAALEWLEAQTPPVIHASAHTSRTSPVVYVPPNDPKASRAAKTYIKVMPHQRPRQARRFAVARPDDPLMALIWEDRRASARGVRCVERDCRLRRISRPFSEPDPMPVPAERCP